MKQTITALLELSIKHERARKKSIKRGYKKQAKALNKKMVIPSTSIKINN